MKRFASLLTVAVLALTLSMGTFAAVAAPGVAADLDAKNFQTVLKANAAKDLIQLDKKSITVDKLGNLQVVAGSELKIYLTDTMFTDSKGTVLGDPAKPKVMTRAQLRTAKLTMRRSTSRGSAAIKSVGIKYDTTGAYIGMQFVSPYVGVDEVDFSTTTYLLINKKRKTGTELTLAGTLANEVVEVYGDYDYIDLSGGMVAEAMERVSKIEVDLGNDLTMFTSMTKGRKYYATCSVDPSNADIRIMEKYPGIDCVYTLKTLNFRSTSDKVYFNLDYSLYAYNSDGKYIGTTDKTLAFSSKYYLSEKKYDSISVK